MKKLIEQLAGICDESKGRELDEASEVKFDELDADKQKQIRQIEKITGSESYLYFDGVNGVIAYFDMRSPMMSTRFMDDTLKKIMATNIRWLEGGERGKFVIGM